MTVIGLLVAIAIAAVVLWALGQFPLDPVLAQLIRVVVIVIVAILLILWLASLFGYHSSTIQFH